MSYLTAVVFATLPTQPPIYRLCEAGWKLSLYTQSHDAGCVTYVVLYSRLNCLSTLNCNLCTSLSVQSCCFGFEPVEHFLGMKDYFPCLLLIAAKGRLVMIQRQMQHLFASSSQEQAAVGCREDESLVHMLLGTWLSCLSDSLS